jgi:hypothetical protein
MRMHTSGVLLITALGLGPGADPATLPAPDSIVCASLANRIAFVITVPPAVMNKTPAWVAGASEPPFPVLKALIRAESKQRELVKDSKGWKWELTNAHLREASNDRWYYEVIFQAHDEVATATTGHPPFLTLLVLMDGTVPEPVVWDRQGFLRAYESGFFDGSRRPAGEERGPPPRVVPDQK